MKLYHCKRCGTFIGGFGYCDELCPTCRRKETYLTKEEVAAMLTELKQEIEKVEIFKNVIGWELTPKTPTNIKQDCIAIIQDKINELKADQENT